MGGAGRLAARGARGLQLNRSHCLWLALLLGLMLPAQLLTAVPLAPGAEAPWPLLPAAGAGLVVVLWLLGGLGSGFVHPVVVTYLLLFVGFRQYLVPHYVLARTHLVAGDVLNAPAGGSGAGPAPGSSGRPTPTTAPSAPTPRRSG